MILAVTFSCGMFTSSITKADELKELMS